MSEINPDHPVTKAAHNHWQVIAAILIHKAQNEQHVGELIITSKDIDDYSKQYNNCGAVLIHEKEDGIHLMLITAEQATILAEKERLEGRG